MRRKGQTPFDPLFGGQPHPDPKYAPTGQKGLDELFPLQPPTATPVESFNKYPTGVIGSYPTGTSLVPRGEELLSPANS